MNDEKWEQVATMIQEKFEISDHGKQELDPGKMEYFEFDSPLGKTRIERIVKPKVIDRKMHTAARIGAEGREELIYSDTETIGYMKVYVWSDDTNQWQEAEAGENLIG